MRKTIEVNNRELKEKLINIGNTSYHNSPTSPNAIFGSRTDNIKDSGSYITRRATSPSRTFKNTNLAKKTNEHSWKEKHMYSTSPEAKVVDLMNPDWEEDTFNFL
jgi:hypothetical protein